mgnify:FL=1
MTPGYAPLRADDVSAGVVEWISGQIRADPASWPRYSERAETRREHLLELRAYLRLAPFGLSDFRRLVRELTELSLQTDKGMVLAGQALESLRQRHITLPPLPVIECAGAEALTRATRRIHQALTAPLTTRQRLRLEALLTLKPDSHVTWLAWLRQSPLKPSSRHLLEHIERLKVYQSLELPPGLAPQVHQNRLLKMAREGGQMTPQDLGKLGFGEQWNREPT